MLKRCIYNFPFMILFVILCSVLFFLNSGSERSIWDDYYVIGLPEGEASDVYESGVFSENEVVSFYNTGFRYNDFGEMKIVPLTDLNNRFVDGDPRIDPFIGGAADYFFTSDSEGRPWELIYIKKDASAWRFFLQTRKSAGSSVDDWIFPDFNIRHRISTILLFCVGWFFGIWLAKGFRPVAAASGLPWFLSVAVNGSGMLPAAVSIFILLILTIKESHSDVLYYLNYRIVRFRMSIYMHLAALAIAFIGGVVLNLMTGMPVVPVILALSAGLVSVFVYYSLRGQRVNMQEHRLFFPVSLISKTGNEITGNKLPEIAASAAAILLIPMFLIFYQYKSPVEVPVPQASVESFNSWSWESLEYIDKTYEGLVNAADLVTHNAYQDGFMFGREWRFPAEGEEIIQGRYVRNGKDIEYRENSVLQFTEDWYLSIIKPVLNEGLPELLLSQHSPGGILSKSDISDTVSNFNPVRYVLICLLTILPILGHLYTFFSITERRKGQEA